LEYTIKLLTRDVGNNWIASVLIEPAGTAEYNAIFNSTWSELKAKYYISSKGHGLFYTLTGYGWMKGCELLGRKTDQNFKVDIGKVAKVLKDSIKGRDNDTFLFTEAVQRESGVPEGLICNIIDSNIFEHWFHKRGAKWESQGRGQLIKIPLDFGLELI